MWTAQAKRWPCPSRKRRVWTWRIWSSLPAKRGTSWRPSFRGRSTACRNPRETSHAMSPQTNTSPAISAPRLPLPDWPPKKTKPSRSTYPRWKRPCPKTWTPPRSRSGWARPGFHRATSSSSCLNCSSHPSRRATGFGSPIPPQPPNGKSRTRAASPRTTWRPIPPTAPAAPAHTRFWRIRSTCATCASTTPCRMRTARKSASSIQRKPPSPSRSSRLSRLLSAIGSGRTRPGDRSCAPATTSCSTPPDPVSTTGPTSVSAA